MFVYVIKSSFEQFDWISIILENKILKQTDALFHFTWEIIRS